MKCSFLIVLVVAVLSCRQESSNAFVGKWQSLNAQGGIEITDQREIDFFKDGLPLWSSAANHPPLKFDVLSQENNWLSFRVMDGDQLFFKGKIEYVNQDRMRIYLYQHHDILDIADEYHRAQDFDSYTAIMENMLKQAE